MDESVLGFDDPRRLHDWVQRGGSVRSLVADGFGPEELPPALRLQYQLVVDLQQDVDDAVGHFNAMAADLAKKVAEEVAARDLAAGRAHP